MKYAAAVVILALAVAADFMFNGGQIILGIAYTLSNKGLIL